MPYLQIGAYISLWFLDSATGIATIEALLSYRLENDMEASLSRASYDHIMNLSCSFHEQKKSSVMWDAMNRGSTVIHLFKDILFETVPSVVDLIVSVFVLWSLFGPYLGWIVAMTGVSTPPHATKTEAVLTVDTLGDFRMVIL